MEIYYDNKLHDIEKIGLLERDFIDKTIRSFLSCDPANFQYVFHIINGYENEPIDESLITDKSIVIIFDEHCGDFYSRVAKAKAIFQTHISEAATKGDNHYCFALGYNCSFKKEPYRPINQRKLNVFYSGNLHRGRAAFYSWLTGLKIPFFLQHRLQKLFKLKFDSKFPDSYIRFTSQFNTGLSGEEYSRMIADSKIILCPGGSVNVESFRIYEAMMQGSIVISDKLPHRNLFQSCPIIELEDWNKATLQINNLLQNPSEMERLSQTTLNWYNETVSPEALGNYINKIID